MDLRPFIKRNASTILTCVGATGVIATTVMAVKATPKALSLLEKAEEEKGEKLTKWEKVNTVGLVYIPTVIAGVATITCIFGSNILSKRQQAAIASAYALLDTSYREYKKKTEELYGEEAGERIREGIAKDKYAGDKELLEDGKELFFDFYSGRYFESTKDVLMMAQYETNRAMFVNGAVGLNEYYEFVGLEKKPEYDSIGWSCGQLEEAYWHPWIEFDYEDMVIEEESENSEGIECTIVHFPMEPFMGYLEY